MKIALRKLRSIRWVPFLLVWEHTGLQRTIHQLRTSYIGPSGVLRHNKQGVWVLPERRRMIDWKFPKCNSII